MASRNFNQVKLLWLQAMSAYDIRARLVMSNTTIGTQDDASIANIDDFTTVDVCDGASYADVALTSEAFAKDDANDWATFDAADVTFAGLGVGTRQTVGMLLYRYVDGTDANDVPLCYFEFSGAVTHDGTDFTVRFNETGVLKLA